MSTQRLHIEPAILSWILERRGIDVEEYRQRNDMFDKWITGEQDPTFRQAEGFAKSNYVPMRYLYMSEPLVETMPIPFFRSQTRNVENLNVMDTVKIMSERQSWLSEYLHGENYEKRSYVNSVSINMNVETVAKKMHETLDLNEDWALGQPTVEKAIKEFTNHLENIGCVVVFNSMVGFSSKRRIEVADCRGFCLVDDIAPFIFVNSRDAKQAQLFTLAHEFAHIMLGYSAGMGGNEDMTLGIEENFCDKVAAIFLVPSTLFRNMWQNTDGNIDSLVKKFKISRWVVARRAKELGLIAENQYWILINKWKMEPIIDNDGKSGMVKFVIRAVRYNGRAFLVHVNNALDSQKLLYRDAYRLTGIKGDTFNSVVKSNYFLGV